MQGKVVIFSAPSGAGKTTIVRHLLTQYDQLAFSVSATSRNPRGEEVDGKDYHFMPVETFKSKIKEGAFLEWEEVYNGCFYGTLRSEIERLFNESKTVIFDVDVMGGLHLKSLFGANALAVFIKPPSEAVLMERLVGRQTESKEKIAQRISKANKELTYETRFDVVILNDELQKALETASSIVGDFLSKS